MPGLGAWWYRILLPRYLRSLGPRRIICVSETVRTRLAQHCAFPVRKMVTVHNGIDSRASSVGGVSQADPRHLGELPKTR